ncbi:MAG: porin family protein [Gallionella sp.]|nr:porin family protein [Gallionella sp.]
MQKIVLAALLSSFVTAPAFAEGSPSNVGIDASLDGVIGIHGELNISPAVNNAPVSVQAFYKKDSGAYSGFGFKADHKALGVTGIYDLNTAFKLDKRMSPYAGAGLVRETKGAVSPFGILEETKTKLYLTGGFRYTIAPKITADASVNTVFDLAAGINFNF